MRYGTKLAVASVSTLFLAAAANLGLRANRLYQAMNPPVMVADPSPCGGLDTGSLLITSWRRAGASIREHVDSFDPETCEHTHVVRQYSFMRNGAGYKNEGIVRVWNFGQYNPGYDYRGLDRPITSPPDLRASFDQFRTRTLPERLDPSELLYRYHEIMNSGARAGSFYVPTPPYNLRILEGAVRSALD